MGKTGGGKGTNQYQTRGVAKGKKPAAPMPTLELASGKAGRICGEVWGTDCQVQVLAPHWSHAKHGMYGPHSKVIQNPNCPYDGYLAVATLSNNKKALGKALRMLSPTDALEVLSTRSAHGELTASCYGAMLYQKDGMTAAQKVQFLDMLNAKMGKYKNAPPPMELGMTRYEFLADADIPEDVLRRCTRSPGQGRAAMRNPNMPADLLAKILQREYIPGINADMSVPDILRCAVDACADPNNKFIPSLNDILAAIAANPHTPSDALRKLGTDDVEVLYSLYHNPNTPKGMLSRFKGLEWLSPIPEITRNSSSRGLRQGVPPSALTSLSDSPAPGIRLLVARHRDNRPEVLAKLAGDQDRQVRSAVAGNPGAPPQAITALALDDDEGVREAARNNPNLPEYTRAMLVLAKD